MPGLGKYKKGKKFELKSGNNPAFKMMGTPESGDSPITKGSSPYTQLADPDDQEKLMTAETGKEAQGVVDGGSGGGGKKILKKIGKVALASITSGLDAVYGTGKVVPGEKFKFSDDDDKDDDKNKDE